MEESTLEEGGVVMARREQIGRGIAKHHAEGTRHHQAPKVSRPTMIEEEIELRPNRALESIASNWMNSQVDFSSFLCFEASSFLTFRHYRATCYCVVNLDIVGHDFLKFWTWFLEARRCP